jgi:aminoglycoside phosphotransferase (APT) family kinase protein
LCQPVVIAVLDWELASIGDPMMDLAYACMIYHWPEEIKVIFPNHDDGMCKIFKNKQMLSKVFVTHNYSTCIV